MANLLNYICDDTKIYKVMLSSYEKADNNDNNLQFKILHACRNLQCTSKPTKTWRLETALIAMMGS